ncbi:hypothetical protein WJX75_002235 [Coccomyxa subellipsoidea]|uniref:CHRD domain-containing protein n=1 Tax=Coccomyxa subellipsoidea TaxID=248742 RepID=A0ABR2YL07_9CHLO
MLSPIKVTIRILITALFLRLAPIRAQGTATVGAPAPEQKKYTSFSPTPYMYDVLLLRKNEVPSVTNQSRALGYLLVHFMPDTNALYYDLVLSNVYGPTVAELHEGDASTANGPPVLNLHNATLDPDNITFFSGRLASGILTPEDFLGPAKDIKTMSSFIDQYVITADLGIWLRICHHLHLTSPRPLPGDSQAHARCTVKGVLARYDTHETYV